MPIIDAHAHLGSAARVASTSEDVDGVLVHLQALGITTAACSHHAELYGHRDQGHRELMAAHERSQGRLLGYTVFSPWQQGSAEWVNNRLLSGRPYVGIKIHPSFHELDASDPAYRPAWELAAKHGVPLLAHTWAAAGGSPAQAHSAPKQFARWLAEFPQVAFIMGHAGGRPAGHRAAAALAREHRNVYLDLAGDSYTWGLIEYLVAEAGANRVLFATDFTWMDPRTHLGRVLAADIEETAKRSILFDNAARLFHLE